MQNKKVFHEKLGRYCGKNKQWESIFLAGINTEKENRNYLAIGDKLGRVDVACLWAPLHLFLPRASPHFLYLQRGRNLGHFYMVAEQDE